ncbi:MAG: glycerol-3-phosphate dehydrogenase/oxidase [Verrucomicrobiota bacterium]|nr:glycerol-3-phosphate dehydrogenase/oxidase [Verrucomicrobiota bacterium]
MFSRDHSLDCIRNDSRPYDFIIVGGGATGLGTAVDAASRGHRVLLVEQSDFAKGTSSRSTKLVHGGVRYLRQGNISLVLEALRERGLLYRNAPHLVHNRAFLIPTFKWWEGPFYGVGMKVYDSLAGRLGLSPSRVLCREETLARLPTVEPEGLTGGVVYHDGQFDDSRLAINLAQTAATHGAILANYVQCIGLVKEGGFVRGVRIRDGETGDEMEVRGSCVINATGVFVDSLRQLDDPTTPRMLALSQGIHLVLPRAFLPGDTALMVPKTADGRVLFCVPWHDCVVIGTTDTPVATAALEPRALQTERDFVMEHAALYLSKDPTADDVLSIFAGLRPLVKTGDASNTAALSRDHTILIAESGLLTVTGGKWTTYRKMAEDVIDQAEMVAGVENKPCQTRTLPIHGWTYDPPQEPNLAVYGADAMAVRNVLNERPDLAEPIHPALSLRRGEVLWHARHEMARTVEDILARRSRALLLNARASIACAPAVAHLLAIELGKDAAWERQQVTAYQAIARGYDFTDAASTG